MYLCSYASASAAIGTSCLETTDIEMESMDTMHCYTSARESELGLISALRSVAL